MTAKDESRVPTTESRVPSPDSRPTYVELRAHTAFSFGQGACTPEALVARAAALGYEAIGLTDVADLGGIVRFATACREHGVRPIVGLELAVDGLPLALVARDATGYRALAALVTRARAGRVGDWRREDAGAGAGTPARGMPDVAWAQVAERSAGLWLLTGPTSGRLARHVAHGRLAEAERLLDTYRATFGAHAVVEVQWHHAGRREASLAGALIALAERHDMPWVVTGDPRYVDADGRRVLDVLTALRHGVTIDEATTRGLLLPNDEWCLQDPHAVAYRWADNAAGVATSRAIAESCTFDVRWIRPPLPDFPGTTAETVDAVLRDTTLRGAAERWGEPTAAQLRQIDHELGVIRQLGFAGFFLTMWDAVRYAKSLGILCQGRGSAANSAVTYCLGVTAVDPIEHGLLFERFLSVPTVDDLIEAPDIDLDIEHDKRELVLDYMYTRYGRAHAALTAVTQRYSASTAVQDVCRAYGVPAETAFALSKRVHRDEPAEGAAKLRAGLAEQHGLPLKTARDIALVDAIAAFEGLPRLRSTHPGGFVLSAKALGDYCPIEPTTMGRTIIQFDKDDLDALKIPKYDFLGLGSLSAVRRAFDVVERYEPRPELYSVRQDDAAAYALIARGDTIGLFQIESRAQIASLVNTKPERMYDIVVQVALIRPGPIVAKFVHPYTERRRGRARIVYPDGLGDTLGPILNRTMGIPIFQEQAMRMAMDLAGYTAAEADELRRTMGHMRKQPRLKAALDKLRGRMRDHGVADDVAARIADDLMSFANYGFPESHAWSFALIAYVTAWLKANHATAFYIGLLNAQPMGFYSVATLVHDARRHGVEVRLPDLVLGDADCTAEASASSVGTLAMRAGWRLIRGLSTHALDALVAARAARPFASIADVVRRAGLTRTDALALARAQAFASWQPDRRRATWEALRAVGDTLPLAPASGIETRDDDGFAARPMTRHEAVFADYHAVGLSVDGHPTERFRAWARRMGALDTAQLAAARSGERVIVVGLVTIIQRPATAKGVVFVLLEDEVGSANVIIWPKLFAAARDTVSFSDFLAVYGQVERDGGLVSLIARRFLSLGVEHASDAAAASAESMTLTHRARSFR